MTKDGTMTDEQLAADVVEGARDLIDRVKLHSPDPIGQAAALLTAATAIIEREVGVKAAPAALTTLTAPTWADWQARGAAVGAALH